MVNKKMKKSDMNKEEVTETFQILKTFDTSLNKTEKKEV